MLHSIRTGLSSVIPVADRAAAQYMVRDTLGGKAGLGTAGEVPGYMLVDRPVAGTAVRRTAERCMGQGSQQEPAE